MNYLTGIALEAHPLLGLNKRTQNQNATSIRRALFHRRKLLQFNKGMYGFRQDRGRQRKSERGMHRSLPKMAHTIVPI